MTDKKCVDTLVLSGGGIKGFLLLGGIQCAIDLGYLENITNYIGTSIGSIICYLLAIGYTPIEIIVSLYSNKWLERMQYFNLVAMINGNGATSFTNINECLEKLTIDKIGRFLTLGKLKEIYGKTLICVSYNITTCVTEYIGPENYPDLPCLTALRMSSNIPMVFDKFKYMDNYYVDGGIADNFAILKGEEIGSTVLGLYLEIEENSSQHDPEDGILSYFIKLLQIPVRQITQNKIKSSNGNSIIINIKAGNFKNTLDFNIKLKSRLEMFSTGYQKIKDHFQNKSESLNI